MKLKLAGRLKIIYDAVVKFHGEHGRGIPLGDLGRISGIAAGTTSLLTRELADLGLVVRAAYNRPSGYLAFEISPTKANPYEED